MCWVPISSQELGTNKKQQGKNTVHVDTASAPDLTTSELQSRGRQSRCLCLRLFKLFPAAYSDLCVSQLSLLEQNARESQLIKRKGLFGSSFCRFQSMNYWICGKTSHYNESAWQSRSHLMTRTQNKGKSE